MSARNLRWYWGELRDEIRNLFTFHADELWDHFVYVLIMGVATGWLTWMWSRGWERSLTWHVAYSIDALVPGPVGAPFVVPLFFVVGLALVFPLDPYKRFQGILLLIGIGSSAAMFSLLGRLVIVWNEVTLALAFSSVVLGFLYGLSRGSETDVQLKRYDGAFATLWWIVLIGGVWGFVEAHLVYDSPFLFGRGWVGLGPFLGSLGVFPGNPGLDAAFALLDVVFLTGLLYVLDDFTDYEMNKNVMIIGPDRGGKTWLMGGAGYSLKHEAAFGGQTMNPIPQTSDMEAVVTAFERGNFTANVLSATNTIRRLGLRFKHGLIAKRDVTVHCLDYPGERMKDATFAGPEAAAEMYIDQFGIDPSTYTAADFGDVVQTSIPSGGNRDKRIGAVLSACVAKADTIGMVVPMDDFVSDLEADDLPDHLDLSDLDKGRGTSRSDYLKMYEQVLKNYDGDKDIFFIPTMSDTLLNVFEGNPLTKSDWIDFRRLVWQRISLQDPNQNSNDIFHPGVHLNMEEYYPQTRRPGPVYPVYLQPHPSSNRFEPKLDWNDQRYPLRGLDELLKVLGR